MAINTDMTNGADTSTISLMVAGAVSLLAMLARVLGATFLVASIYARSGRSRAVTIKWRSWSIRVSPPPQSGSRKKRAKRSVAPASSSTETTDTSMEPALPGVLSSTSLPDGNWMA